eukprot:TRINITY_DN6566_c0_g1_i10.p1 TRINITY_DN6566_c0_g1~~TRINITY_DN6566_c0_g1_i10.p1  ORF type:complete len:300 (+),score=101.12 TRINITY_DN6566_c0_g1_i10:406-1305(+)
MSSVKKRDVSAYIPEAPSISHYTADESYCKAHPDEEVKYFCFDCLTPPICSECVIHGIHKDHEVMHVKKGLPVVKAKLEEVIQGLVTCIEGLEGNKKGIMNRKQNLLTQAEDAKGQLNTIMEDLIARISKKHKELVRNIDTATNDALKELESYERVIDGKMSTLTSNVKFIQENMANGPLPTLYFYADNNKLLVQVAEQGVEQEQQYIACTAQASLVSPEGIVRDTKEVAGCVAEAMARISIGTMRNNMERREASGFRGRMKENINEEYIDEYNCSLIAHSHIYPVSYTHLTLPTICSV